MLPFNALNERKKKQETWNRKRSFWLLPSFSRSNERDNQDDKHAFTDSRLSRKAFPHFFRPPFEEDNKAEPEGFAIHWLPGQSKAKTSLVLVPIEGGQQNANRRVLLPESKDLFFTSFYLIFFPLHFYALQYGCNSVGFIFCTFYCFIQILVNRCVW